MGKLPRQTVAGLETAGEVVIVDLPSSDLLKVGPKRRSPRARSLTPYLFLAIPVVLLVVLTYVPMVETFALSLYNWDGFGQSHIQFVGLQNYFSFFTDPAHFGDLFVSLYYLV